jgi:hypothetical protein
MPGTAGHFQKLEATSDTWSLGFQLLEVEGINFLCLSHPDCWALLWLPQEDDLGVELLPALMLGGVLRGVWPESLL